MNIIPREYYQGEDVVAIAKDLLGKKLITNLDGIITSGLIVETEAYNGLCDKACHAYNGRRTARTEVMYKTGGVAYVYLCYGIHSLFNIVTNKEGRADAVLIRAIEPLDGIEKMMERRKHSKLLTSLTSGPGAMSEALGIKTSHSGIDLTGNKIWLEEVYKTPVVEQDILIGARVGVGYAEEDALLPWRFRIANNKWCSKAK